MLFFSLWFHIIPSKIFIPDCIREDLTKNKFNINFKTVLEKDCDERRTYLYAILIVKLALVLKGGSTFHRALSVTINVKEQ